MKSLAEPARTSDCAARSRSIAPPMSPSATRASACARKLRSGWPSASSVCASRLQASASCGWADTQVRSASPLPRSTAGASHGAAKAAPDAEKDADGLHPVNLGRLVLNAPGPLPCTPFGIVELLRRVLPVSKGFDGEKFWTVENGKKIATPLLMVIALVGLKGADE